MERQSNSKKKLNCFIKKKNNKKQKTQINKVNM